MAIRKFKNTDTAQIVTLFYETVHTVNARDYSLEQLEAWAPIDEKEAKIADWKDTLSRNITYVAEIGGTIIGFSEMTATGYLNRLYIHKDFQGQGLASAFIQILEREAKSLKLDEIRTDASITAKSFFERHGYQVIQSQSVERRGVLLVNFNMVKKIE